MSRFPGAGRARALYKVARVLGAANRVLAMIAGMVIAGIGITITANVILRTQGAAIFGVEEIIQISMIPVIFLAIAYCSQIDGHITVDILHPLLPQWIWTITEPVVRLTSAAVFFALAYKGAHAAQEATLYGETTNLRRFPLGPAWWTLSGGAALAGLIELLRILPGWQPGPHEDESE
jgi:TRAP-type C4-dicarboxylate transport system permease small subunit